MAASWNPAFRPNSDDPSVEQTPKSLQNPTDPPLELSSEPSFEVVDKDNAVVSDPADAWLTQDGDDNGAGNWLDDTPFQVSEVTELPPSEPVTVDEADVAGSMVPANPEATVMPESFHEEDTRPAEAQPEEAQPEAAHSEAAHSDAAQPEEAQTEGLQLEAAQPENSQPENSQPEQPTPPTAAAPKHASVASFARTVSHEVNWDDGDGEDNEWNLGTTDTTDPFQFMPPSDRTNSFPAVPQQAVPISTEEHALPSTQVQEMMEEVEAGGNSPVGHGDAVFGADIHGTEEEASTARFEEGIPLIPSSNDTSNVATDSKPSAGPNDPFAGNDDDFFSQIQSQGGPAGPGIDRKSTMQAMVGDTGISSLHREDTLEDVTEDPNEVAASTLERAAEDVPQTKDVLTDTWGEVFGDDLDDEFLVDDSAENKEQTSEIDPSTFFGSDDEGFLDDGDDGDDGDDAQPVATAKMETPAGPTPMPSTNRYAPQAAAPALTHQASNPYFPPGASYHNQPQLQSQPSYGYGTPISQAAPFGMPQTAPAPLQTGPKAQSFADKTKGGYSSPYDLPMEVVKPKKRQSAAYKPSPMSQQVAQPPPRSSSVASQGPPPATGGVRPPSRDNLPSPTDRRPSQVKQKESFFEDLPITSKPRPSSRPGTSRVVSPQAPPAGAGPSLYSPVTAGAAPSQMARSMSGGASNQYAPPPSATPQMARTASSSSYAPMPTSAPPPMARSGSGGSYAPPPMASSGSGGTPSMAAPAKHSPYAAAPQSQMQPQRPPPQQQQSQQQPHPGQGGIPDLVRPEKVNPYSAIPGQSYGSHPPPSQSYSAPPQPPTSRYSPAQPLVAATSTTSLPNGAPPPAASTRYSPAPPSGPGSRPSSGYGHGPPMVLSHQPRTSSPLATFESHSGANGEIVHHDRRSSSHYEHKTSRIAALPPTREVEEENEAAPMLPNVTRTPPPAPLAQAALSPPKRSPYVPQSATQALHHGPPRPINHSPSTMHAATNGPARDSLSRSSSVSSPTSPMSTRAMAPTQMPMHRRRAPSVNLNMVAPTDGREQDPLKRWRGSPIITWGMGGTMVTTFPKDIPRYGGISQTAPFIHRVPGEVKVTHINDIQPLEERFAKFPGPLKGKSKKKETMAWLTTGIDELEKQAPDMTYVSSPSHDEKRAIERLLLWKILRVFIENDGVVEGNPTVVKAIRELLAPGVEAPPAEESPSLGAAMTDNLHSGASEAKVDSVDLTAMEQIRKHLMVGDREKAAWGAADKRLWGHALLIANTVSADLYKQVAEDFIRKEVNFPGHNNESLAALYKVLSGNFEDCVDELVPSHARAGLQLVGTTSSASQTKDALEGLDKWKETLCLVLSNRSLEDVRALMSLGDLLMGYGRAEAAHICFIFSRQVAVFGGLDDARSNYVLVGADHRRQSDQFFKETEALMLSEVFEYGLFLAGGNANTAPHLSAYKLNFAMTLAEYGHRDKALQYCDGILNSIAAQSKRSPYHHALFEQTVEDFIKRLKQAPTKESSNSWISKPSMNKVSDSMWNRFNKFVAGDEHEAEGAAGSGNGPNDETGSASPFAKIGDATPNISRPPSSGNFETYGNPMAGYPLGQPQMPMPGATPVAQPTTRPASRYAPAAPQPSGYPSPYEPAASQTQTPRSSMERTSSDLHRSPYEPMTAAGQSKYAPAPASAPAMQPNQAPPVYGMDPEQTYGTQPAPEQTWNQPSAPTPAVSSYTPQPAQEPQFSSGPPYGYSPQPAQPSAYGATPEAKSEEQGGSHNGTYQPSFGYEPPSMGSVQAPTPSATTAHESTEETSGGYEAPSYQSYGYEPPSYEPPTYEPDKDDDDDQPKPKKKNMFDDDDDMPGSNKSQEKTKEEKDRENAEMFRKVAEEEAKREAEKKAAAKKGGWGLGGWWGGGKKETMPKDGGQQAGQAGKPIRAKLGEESSFVYDPDMKRWVNRKAGAEQTEAKKATPPPPRSSMPPRSANSTPPPPAAGTPPPPMGRSSAPPVGPGFGAGGGGPPPRSVSNLLPPMGDMGTPLMGPAGPRDAAGGPGASSMPMMRSVSNNSTASAGGGGPPPRPSTSMSNASSIDDLIGAAAPRKGGAKKAKKGGSRYIDVMAK